MTLAPTELYTEALARRSLLVRTEEGTCRRVPLERWLGPVGPADAGALDRALGPVLDVGCGPGRHVLALARRGVLAVGVDMIPGVVGYARARGAAVVLGSVFAPIPGAGRWRTALLLDGNIGIGGRPAELLERLRDLLTPRGRILCELDPPGAPTRSELIALEDEEGRRSTWFPWASVGLDGVERVAARATMRVEESWHEDGRWFAQLSSVHQTVSKSSCTASA